ncbi:hypothetical protein KA183_21060 [bacterium]|nr:hypothetical protein [bacterium]
MVEGAQKAHHAYADADADADAVAHVGVDAEDIEVGAYCHSSFGSDCASMHPSSLADILTCLSENRFENF